MESGPRSAGLCCILISLILQMVSKPPNPEVIAFDQPTLKPRCTIRRYGTGRTILRRGQMGLIIIALRCRLVLSLGWSSRPHFCHCPWRGQLQKFRWRSNSSSIPSFDPKYSDSIATPSPQAGKCVFRAKWTAYYSVVSYVHDMYPDRGRVVLYR